MRNKTSIFREIFLFQLNFLKFIFESFIIYIYTIQNQYSNVRWIMLWVQKYIKFKKKIHLSTKTIYSKLYNAHYIEYIHYYICIEKKYSQYNGLTILYHLITKYFGLLRCTRYWPPSGTFSFAKPKKIYCASIL